MVSVDTDSGAGTPVAAAVLVEKTIVWLFHREGKTVVEKSCNSFFGELMKPRSDIGGGERSVGVQINFSNAVTRLAWK